MLHFLLVHAVQPIVDGIFIYGGIFGDYVSVTGKCSLSVAQLVSCHYVTYVAYYLADVWISTTVYLSYCIYHAQ